MLDKRNSHSHLRKKKKGDSFSVSFKYAPSAPADFSLSHPLSLSLKAGSCDLPFITASLNFFPLFIFSTQYLSLAHRHFSMSSFSPVFLLSTVICPWCHVFGWCIYLFANSKSTLMGRWGLCRGWSPCFKTPHTFLCHVTGFNQKPGVNYAAISRANISLPAAHSDTMSTYWMWTLLILCMLLTPCFSLHIFHCNYFFEVEVINVFPFKHKIIILYEQKVVFSQS